MRVAKEAGEDVAGRGGGGLREETLRNGSGRALSVVGGRARARSK